MTRQIYLSLIIPAYNEETKIGHDIHQAFNYLQKQPYTFEVIVVSDGSTDQTNQLITQLQKNFPQLVFIKSSKRFGKGIAIKKGVTKARGKYIMFADAGYCVPFKFIQTGLKLLKTADIAIGSRALAKSRIRLHQPIYRQLGSFAFSQIIHRYIGIPQSIPDTQCGFKLFRGPVAKKLFAQLQSPQMMFDIEILLRAHRHGYSIVSFPVDWTNDPQTSLKPMVDAWKILRQLHQIKSRNS